MYLSVTNLHIRWIMEWDIELRLKNRQIALTLDNFTGHTIQYQPKNITLIYFEPGLTSHIQPLDAGIIRCFKAHYRRQFCLRAIQQDDAEEEDIYKIDLLEAMTMAERAWKSVSPTTIKNCWNHTEIQRPRLPVITLRPPRPPMPPNLAAGWDIVVQFATNSWPIPETHASLQEHLGDQYVASEWKGPLDAALGAEGDAGAALAAINAWRNKWAPDNLCEAAMTPNDHSEVEEELLDLVTQLKARRRITGQPLTLDEMLDPKEEREVGECLNIVDGGDDEIIAMVRAKVGLARGDVEEISSDSDNGDPEVVPRSLKEMIEACRMLEENSLLVCTDALDFVEAARQFRGRLQKMSGEHTKQTTIDMFFNTK